MAFLDDKEVGGGSFDSRATGVEGGMGFNPMAMLGGLGNIAGAFSGGKYIDDGSGYNTVNVDRAKNIGTTVGDTLGAAIPIPGVGKIVGALGGWIAKLIAQRKADRMQDNKETKMGEILDYQRKKYDTQYSNQSEAINEWIQ